MAIINTLITARDNTSGVFKKTADNVKKSANDMSSSLDKASKSSDYLQGSFDNFRNIDTSSVGGFVESLQRINDQMNNAEDNTAAMLIRIGGAAGAFSALTYVVLQAVNASSEYVNQLNETATASNATIERLQQMQQVFKSTGIEVEKFGDLNKDTLDHLGDAFRDGSGPAEDMKAYGLNLKDYNKYLNSANGGLNALIHTFYEMKKAGKSQAEIVNMMETLASDSSHLISTFEKLGSEQNALNAIASAHAGITEETAKKYKEYENRVKELTVQFETFKANALAPTVDDLNKILEILNADWNGTNFTKWVNQFMFGGDTPVAKMLRGMGDLSPLDYDTSERTNLQSLMNNALADQKAINPEKEPAGGWVNKEKEKAAADAAAKKAAAEAARFAKQREEAAKWLDQLDMDNATEQKKAELNYDIQLKKVKKFFDDKLLSQAQYNHAVQALNSQLDSVNRAQNESRQLEAASNIRDQGLSTEYEYQERVLQIKRDYQIRALDAEYYTEMERLQYLHDAKLLKEEDFQNQMAGLRSKHEYDTSQVNKTADANLATNKYKEQADSLERYSSTMTSVTNLASQMGATIAASAEQGSAAWVAATVVTKAAAVAQAIISANLAAAQVMASPSSLTLAQKVAESNIIRTMGYASAAMIAAQGIADIAGARERGGGVQAGKTYLVGEKGPELLTMGANSGNITNNRDLQSISGGSGGGNTFHQTNHFHNSGLKQEDLNMLKVSTEAIFDKKMNDEMRGGGKLSRVP